MRALALMVIAIGLLVGTAPATAASSISGPRAMLVQERAPGPAMPAVERRPISTTDMIVRLVYAALGAGAGYMYATMPLTTTAVAAAFTGGIITMWVYSSYYAEPRAG